VTWVIVCLIIHNLIIDIEQGINEQDPFYHYILQQGQDPQTDWDTHEGGYADQDGYHWESHGQQMHNMLKDELMCALVEDSE